MKIKIVMLIILILLMLCNITYASLEHAPEESRKSLLVGDLMLEIDQALKDGNYELAEQKQKQLNALLNGHPIIEYEDDNIETPYPKVEYDPQQQNQQYPQQQNQQYSQQQNQQYPQQQNQQYPQQQNQQYPQQQNQQYNGSQNYDPNYQINGYADSNNNWQIEINISINGNDGQQINTQSQRSSHNTRVPHGELQQFSYFNQHGEEIILEVMLKNVSRGRSAWERVRNANDLNPYPDYDNEYMIAQVYIKIIKSSQPLRFTQNQFYSISGNGRRYNNLGKVSGLQYDIDQYNTMEGGYITGTICLPVNQNDNQPLIGFSPDGRTEILFETTQYK